MIQAAGISHETDPVILLDAIRQKEEKIALLEHELAQLKRLIFGTKSERFVPVDPNQLQLEIEGMEQQSKAPSTQSITYTRKTPESKNKAVRAPIPAHLPRKEEIIEPEALPEGAIKIGEEITEILEYNPGNIFVRKIIRPKYALPEDKGVSIADLPSLPIPKGNAGPGLLAHILVSKFVDHLPFYRQQQMFIRNGIEIAKTTFNGWFNGSSDLLVPLYEKLKQKVLATDYLMGDESPIPVQDNHRKGTTHTGYHWVYYAPLEKLVCFDYRDGRGRACPDEFLRNFKGVLQTDGYAGYNQFEHSKTITLHGCMAHARRKFDQALDNDQPRAEHMLGLIGQLYTIERKAREQGLSFIEREMLRDECAVPILDEMEQWLKGNLAGTLPKSPIGKAIGYTLGLWHRLKRYLDDGKYEIDNNLVENSIRPLALGRKNYLFAGSHAAAQRAAMMYSFLGSCKKNQIEPFEWLRHTLEVIADYKASRLEELLPVNLSTTKTPPTSLGP